MAFYKVFFMADDDCSCGCGCESGHDGECCDEICEDEDVVVLTDTETGEEYSFVLVDSFEFEDQEYVVLIDPDEDVDDAEEMSLFFMKVTKSEDGEEILTALEDDEDDRVFEAYNELLDEYEEDEDEDEEDETEE